MKSLVAVLLLLVVDVFAFEISKREGRLVLADRCEDGGAIYQSLARWSQNAQTGKSCDANARMQTKTAGKCEIDITECVPEHVVQYHNARPEIDGPNCWNLSLVMSNILPSLRYSTPEEMNFYMRPPLCRELKDGEAREPGDVGAIRQITGFAKTQEYHGFIYISDKIAYSKNGFSNRAPYQLQSLDNVYDVYSVPKRPECRKNQISSESAQCRQAVAFFRCDSMESYLSKTPNVPAEIRDSFERMKKAEDCVQQATLSGTGVLSQEARTNLRETGQALLAYLEKEKTSKETSGLSPDERDFLVGSLQLRLEAVAEQMSVGGVGDAETYMSYAELKGFSGAIEVARRSIKGTK